MKIQLLTSIKGHQVWERGLIMTSPFPADVQSLVNDVRVIKILEKDEPIVKVEEPVEVVLPKEPEEIKKEVVVPEVTEKKTVPLKKVVLKKRG